MKILDLTVTEDISHKGSNIAEDSRRTSSLVTRVLYLGMGARIIKERMSVTVFYRIPKMLTSLVSTAAFSLEALMCY